LRKNKVGTIAAQVTELTQTSEQLRIHLENGLDDYSELGELIAQIKDRIHSIEKELYFHSQRPDYPIHWQSSTARLALLTEQSDEIPSINAVRTITSLHSDLQRAHETFDNLIALDNTCRERIAQAHELRILWIRLKTILEEMWFSDIFQLSECIGDYSVENWDSADRVGQFLSDARKMFASVEAAVPIDIASEINEEQLSFLLEEASRLAEEQDEIEQRQLRIQQRYHEVVEREVSTQEVIHQYLPTLGRIATELSNYSFPFDTMDELFELFGEGERLSLEINHPSSGNVFDKAARVSSWASAAEITSSQLIVDLQDEIDVTQNHLAELLGESQKYAGQIVDPAVQEAEKYRPVNVYAFEISPIKRQTVGTATNPLQETFVQIRELSQTLDAVGSRDIALETNISFLRDEYDRVEDLGMAHFAR